jgi:glycerol-3-phosphate acyltransferase PlsY
MVIQPIFLTIVAYLIGSVSTGVVLSKIFGQGNLQTEGSKNIGATNVSRLMGMKWGILTLIGDTLKGLLVVWIGLWVFAGEGDLGFLYVALMALAVFLGHIFPVFLGFKGGKGVAVILGKYVSLGSIVAAGSFPVVIYFFHYNRYVVFLSIAIAAAIILKHKENILRLIKGEEKPWRAKGKTS